MNGQTDGRTDVKVEIVDDMKVSFEFLINFLQIDCIALACLYEIAKTLKNQTLILTYAPLLCSGILKQ